MVRRTDECGEIRGRFRSEYRALAELHHLISTLMLFTSENIYHLHLASSRFFLCQSSLKSTMSSTERNLGLASTIAPPSKNHNYRIASIPADGIGPEVVSAAIEVVERLAKTLGTFTIEFTHIPWGTAYYKKHGRYVDENVLEVLKSYDASLFGSVGAPGNSSHDEAVHLLMQDRCARSYLPVGVAPSHPWPTSTVRQCPSRAYFPRNTVTSPDCGRQRYRLAACKGEFRGRVFRPRRSFSQGPNVGSCYRSRDLYLCRRRENHALRFRSS